MADLAFIGYQPLVFRFFNGTVPVAGHAPHDAASHEDDNYQGAEQQTGHHPAPLETELQRLGLGTAAHTAQTPDALLRTDPPFVHHIDMGRTGLAAATAGNARALQSLNLNRRQT